MQGANICCDQHSAVWPVRKPFRRNHAVESNSSSSFRARSRAVGIRSSCLTVPSMSELPLNTPVVTATGRDGEQVVLTFRKRPRKTCGGFKHVHIYASSPDCDRRPLLQTSCSETRQNCCTRWYVVLGIRMELKTAYCSSAKLETVDTLPIIKIASASP